MSSEAGVRSTSAEQERAWSTRDLPAPERVAEGIWAIAAPIPEGAIPHTLTYVLESQGGGIHLIDPGWDSRENLTTLTSSLRSLGHSLEDVETVIATHHHPDHLGIADRLRGISGATVLFSAVEREVLAQQTAPGVRDQVRYASVLEGWGVPRDRRAELAAAFDRPSLIDDMVVDRALADGDLIQLVGHTLRVIATPGHTDGHICLVDAARGLLYSGDHILPGIYSGIGIGTLPGSEPLGDYLASVDKLAPLDELEILPGHEFRFTGLGARRGQIVAHHLRRTREVASLADAFGNAPVWDYAQHLTWTAGWDGLSGFWLHSALRQTEMHLDLVRSGQAKVYLDARGSTESSAKAGD